MIFRIGGLHYWYVPVINNKNEREFGIFPGIISTGMDNRTSKDCSIFKILDQDFWPSRRNRLISKNGLPKIRFGVAFPADRNYIAAMNFNRKDMR